HLPRSWADIDFPSTSCSKSIRTRPSSEKVRIPTMSFSKCSESCGVRKYHFPTMSSVIAISHALAFLAYSSPQQLASRKVSTLRCRSQQDAARFLDRLLCGSNKDFFGG